MPKVLNITSLQKSLQYLKKDWRDEVDFLQADKHQAVLQDNVINIVEIASHA